MSRLKRKVGGLQLFDRSHRIGSSLSAADLERGVKLEEHTAVLDRFLSETDGTYGWQGAISNGGTVTVPKAALAGNLSAAERVARVRNRLDRGEPPILVTYDLDTDTPIFEEEDQEAYEDGYICGGCLQYQQVPNAPMCNWLRDGGQSASIPEQDRGCGHRNY